MLRFINKMKNNEKGQAMVEFALVAIPLMFLVLGIIEFGWLFNGRINITSAAREGARAAVVRAADDAESAAIEAVRNHVTLINDEDMVIIVNYDTATKKVTVTINAEMTPLVGFFVTGKQPLFGDAIMALE